MHSLWEGAKGYATQIKGKLTGRQHSIEGRVVVEEKKLAEGGFGFVYRVVDGKTGEQFALKKILCQDKERFRLAKREVDILTKLPAHKNIVGFHGASVEAAPGGKGKEVCILLELCPGGHLLDMLDRYQGKPPEGIIVGALKDVSDALVFLHSRNPPIQHRDLKIENVLATSSGSYVLCDFGSWAEGTQETRDIPRTELLALQEDIERYTTMMYRPPEMVDLYSKKPLSVKVDMWMMGCVLYTMMFYKHPFQDESQLAISNARYPIPEHDFSDKLEDALFWLLAMHPDDRPTAKQMVKELETWRTGDLPLPEIVVKRVREVRDGRKRDGKERRRARKQKAAQPAGDGFVDANAWGNVAAPANESSSGGWADFSAAPAAPAAPASPATAGWGAFDSNPAPEPETNGNHLADVDFFQQAAPPPQAPAAAPGGFDNLDFLMNSLAAPAPAAAPAPGPAPYAVPQVVQHSVSNGHTAPAAQGDWDDFFSAPGPAPQAAPAPVPKAAPEVDLLGGDLLGLGGPAPPLFSNGLSTQPPVASRPPPAGGDPFADMFGGLG